MEINTKNLIKKIPRYVSCVTRVLNDAGFEAYLVGGCVRDLLIEREPKDWDITTNAKPEEIIRLFEKTVYENTFGTVGVCVLKEKVAHETSDNNILSVSVKVIEDSSENKEDINVSREKSNLDKEKVTHETNKYHIIEVTPYRLEGKYTDFRHPDKIVFSKNIEDDLKRRDFTMNALAFSPLGKGGIKDIFNGLKDIENKTIRTVGDSNERFREDALRMLRAIRFSLELDFSIETKTADSILKNSKLIEKISDERIRDELVKIIMSKKPSAGILMLHKFGLLKYIIPELEKGIKCEQSGAHIFDVFDHLLHALQHAADKNWSLEIRLSALFHDIGKPKSRRKDKKLNASKKYTFYGHEVVGARIVKNILERLKFSKKEITLVEKLVRFHMFFSDTEKITLSAVRRIIMKVGKENIWTLMNVRECDRVGMKKKEAPYRLRKYFAMIEEALHDPISVKQLKINGEDLMKELHMKPGPRIGFILNALLERILEDPKINDKGHLLKLAEDLNRLGDKGLRTLGEKGKDKKDKLEEKELQKLHAKHHVKK